MPDITIPADGPDADGASSFEALLGAQAAAEPVTDFTTVFRGYDKDEVDAAISGLSARVRALRDEIAAANDRQHRETSASTAHKRETKKRITQLESDLAAASARAANAEQQVQALTDELQGAEVQSEARQKFDEILRVAEDQASVIIKNATVQADRLLEASRAEIEARRKDAQAEAEMINTQAQHDAQQARLRIDTEVTAHEARLEREASHAAEKVAQAEQEAAAIRTEAEKGAAALRSMVARETALARTEAEDAVRELRMRGLEFEEALTRRQDDAQQEFLMLHNQAVAHAERITQDANDQVSASLEHAQRVAAKADDFDRLMRAQAQQIDADAQLRAREHMDRAREKAQKIIDTVTAHSQSVLRDAEDRTRQLRWQQQQLTSFMSEVKELIRLDAGSPGVVFDAEGAEEADDVAGAGEDASTPAVDAAEEAAQESAEAEAAGERVDA